MATAKTSPNARRNRKQPKARAAEKSWTERVLRGVRVLQVPAFSKIPWLVHAFSTRPGGVSETNGEKVLNLGAVEWDTREKVEENKRRFRAAIGASDLALVTLHQIHSDVVRSFDAAPTKPCKGDALV